MNDYFKFKRNILQFHIHFDTEYRSRMELKDKENLKYLLGYNSFLRN